MNVPTRQRRNPPTSTIPSLRGVVLAWSVVLTAAFFTPNATAQITVSRSLSGGGSPVATLEEQLINRLHATTDVQADYLRHIVKLVDQDKLEPRLVVAIERYALRRNPRYPFPYFERALRYEAAKRGVALTALRHYQSTADGRF